MSEQQNIVPNKLALLNAHPRDKCIEFDEPTHVYTVNGDNRYTSVTTLNHAYFSEFNADESIANMMANTKKWEDPDRNKYYGMTPEEIKLMWHKNGVEASTAGTKLHYDIECYYNGLEVHNTSMEWKFFQEFVKDFPELKPYRTEWMVWDDELKISGSIDMLFENPDGTLQIYDWKRCKEIENDAYKNKCASAACIKHLPDCNFWHYSLQLNTYKAILEKNYGKKITAMNLVVMHPDNPYKTYDHIEVADLTKEVADLFELRKQNLKNGLVTFRHIPH